MDRLRHRDLSQAFAAMVLAVALMGCGGGDGSGSGETTQSPPPSGPEASSPGLVGFMCYVEANIVNGGGVPPETKTTKIVNSVQKEDYTVFTLGITDAATCNSLVGNPGNSGPSSGK